MSSIETKTSVVIQKADHFSVRVRPGLMMFSPARYGYLIGILFLLAISTQICMGAESNETIAAAGMVTVTNVVVDPSVLMTGDVGLVTFTVQNTGTSNVVITDAHLISNDVTVLNSEIYLTSRTIGAGTSMEFPFTILVNQPEGIYYPAFYLNYQDAGSLRYNVPIRVETPELTVSANNIPETFTKGVTSTISLVLGNPKSVDITGITIIPTNNDVKINTTSMFVGDLTPHNSTRFYLDVTPSKSTNLAFNVNYTMGMNAHQTSFSLPIELGSDKKAADPVINNVEITSDTGGKKLAGDLSNSGISDAFGVVVSLESAAGDNGNPNQKYAIGTIASGDFSSFEVYIPQNLQSVPLVIQYKDSSGNQFTKKTTIDLNDLSSSSAGSAGGAPAGGMPSGGPPGAVSTGGSSAKSGGGSGGPGGMNSMFTAKGLDGLPIMEIIYGIIGFIGLLVLWKLWKRWRGGKKISISFT